MNRLVVLPIVALLAGCAVPVHQDLVTRTNQSIGVAVSGRPAVAAHVGPAYRIETLAIPSATGPLHAVLATSDPARPLIVFCGGNGFRENAGGGKTLEALAPFGDVLFFDYPGLGQSKGAGLKAEYLAAVDAVSAKAADIASTRTGPTIFWGHSLGGGFCAALASKAKGTSLLVTAGAFASVKDAADGIADERLWFSPLVDARIQDDVINFDIPVLLATYDGPIVVLASKTDRVITFPVSRKLVQKLANAGHRATFVTLESATHTGLFQAPEFFPEMAAALKPFGIAATPLAQDLPAAMEAQPCGKMQVTDGCGTLIWSDGSTYVGGFKGGHFTGKSTVTFADGAKLEADFSDGAKANATYTKADGTVIAGPFEDGRLAGETASAAPPSEGRPILVHFIIGIDGIATDAMADMPKDISAEDGGRFLVGAARLFASWTFVPAKIDGIAVPTIGTATITYREKE